MTSTEREREISWSHIVQCDSCLDFLRYCLYTPVHDDNSVSFAGRAGRDASPSLLAVPRSTLSAATGAIKDKIMW